MVSPNFDLSGNTIHQLDRLLGIPNQIVLLLMTLILGYCAWMLPEASSRCFVNTLKPRQNGQYFADDIFRKPIFLYENHCTMIRISLQCIPKGPFNKKPVLVEIMARLPGGNKPLSETPLVLFIAAFMHHLVSMCVVSFPKIWPVNSPHKGSVTRKIKHLMTSSR